MSTNKEPKVCYLTNKARLKTDRSYYNRKDCYDVPEILREARHKNSYGLPRSITFFDENKCKKNKMFPQHTRESRDESTSYAARMSSMWGSTYLIRKRIKDLFKNNIHALHLASVSNVPSTSSISTITTMVTNSDASSDNLLERAAHKLSQPDLFCGQKVDEETLEQLVVSNGKNQNRGAEDKVDGVFRKFRLKLTEHETVDAVEVSILYNKSIFDKILHEKHDVKSIVLSEKCACVFWVWSSQTRIIVITESSDPNSWSLKQWYNKVLLDIALVNSRLIRHPYYWHPMVRRRLSRVVRQFKKLYRRIAVQEAEMKGLPVDSVTLFQEIERSSGGRRRRFRHSQVDISDDIDFLEEYPDPEDTKANDQFLIGNFVPGCPPGWEHDEKSKLANNCFYSLRGYHLKANNSEIYLPAVENSSLSRNITYNMHEIEKEFEDSLSDGYNANNGENLQKLSNWNMEHSGRAGYGKFCDDDVYFEEEFLLNQSERSEASTSWDDPVYSANKNNRRKRNSNKSDSVAKDRNVRYYDKKRFQRKLRKYTTMESDQSKNID